MKLELERTALTSQSTAGKLSVDGQFFCYTLELPTRDGLPGSAIPAGTYPIELAPSPKFRALAERDSWWRLYCDAMPHIVDIPGRSLIMLHVGNYPSETDGCILVGESQGINAIGGSKIAFSKLYPLIADALRTPPDSVRTPLSILQSPDTRCTITVVDPPATPPLGVDEATQI